MSLEDWLKRRPRGVELASTEELRELREKIRTFIAAYNQVVGLEDLGQMNCYELRSQLEDKIREREHLVTRSFSQKLLRR